MYVERNIEARSLIFLPWKSKKYYIFVCVCVCVRARACVVVCARERGRVHARACM